MRSRSFSLSRSLLKVVACLTICCNHCKTIHIYAWIVRILLNLYRIENNFSCFDFFAFNCKWQKSYGNDINSQQRREPPKWKNWYVGMSSCENVCMCVFVHERERNVRIQLTWNGFFSVRLFAFFSLSLLNLCSLKKCAEWLDHVPNVN